MTGNAKRLSLLAAVLPFSAACQPGEGGVASTPSAGPEAVCDAAAAQEHIGHDASAQSGAILLRLTGARQLRWAPPRSAMTMDYRPDRLTVSYDDNMAITQIICG